MSEPLGVDAMPAGKAAGTSTHEQGWAAGLAQADLTAPVKWGRALTYNPLGAAAVLGTLGATAGYFGYKPALRALSKGFGYATGADSTQLEESAERQLALTPGEAQKKMMLAGGLFAALVPLSLAFSPGAKGAGLTNPYPEWQPAAPLAKTAAFEYMNQGVLGQATLPVGGFYGRPTFEQRADSSGGSIMGTIAAAGFQAGMGAAAGGLAGAGFGYMMGGSPLAFGRIGAGVGAVVNPVFGFMGR